MMTCCADGIASTPVVTVSVRVSLAHSVAATVTDPIAGANATSGVTAISQSSPAGNCIVTLPPDCTRPTVLNFSVWVDSTPGVAVAGSYASMATRAPAAIAVDGTVVMLSSTAPVEARVSTVVVLASCVLEGVRTSFTVKLTSCGVISAPVVIVSLRVARSHVGVVTVTPVGPVISTVGVSGISQSSPAGNCIVIVPPSGIVVVASNLRVCVDTTPGLATVGWNRLAPDAPNSNTAWIRKNRRDCNGLAMISPQRMPPQKARARLAA